MHILQHITYCYVHLGLETLERKVHCVYTCPHGIENVDVSVGDRFGMPALEVLPEAIILVAHHEQQGSSQVVGLEL